MDLLLFLPLYHHLLFVPFLVLHVILQHLFPFGMLHHHLLHRLILLYTLDLLVFPNKVFQNVLERVFLLALPAVHPVLLFPPSLLHLVFLLQYYIVFPVRIYLLPVH